MHDNEYRAFSELHKRVSMLEDDMNGIKRKMGILSEKAKRRREEIMSLPMDELRKIGRPLGCLDTKKSELVDEIVRAENL